MSKLLCAKCDTWLPSDQFKPSAHTKRVGRRLCRNCAVKPVFNTRKCTSCYHILGVLEFEGASRVCKPCCDRRDARISMRSEAEWNPGRKEHVPGRICGVCCDLPHRVVGPKCRGCGIHYAPDLIICDPWRRKTGAWALLMIGGEE